MTYFISGYFLILCLRLVKHLSTALFAIVVTWNLNDFRNSNTTINALFELYHYDLQRNFLNMHIELKHHPYFECELSRNAPNILC